MRRAAVGVVLMVLLVLAGCQKVTRLAHQFDPRTSPEDVAYRRAITPYLVKAAVYRGPATEALFTMLPLNPTVRRAMVEREAAAFDLTPEQVAKRRGDMRAAAARGVEVLLSVYLPQRKWNDLAGPDPTFRVFLEDSGRRYRPVDRRRIRKRTALRQTLYPFWGYWDRLYIFRYPLKRPSPGAKLVVVGPLGHAELPLRWD